MGAYAALRQRSGFVRLAVVMRGQLRGRQLIYRTNAGQHLTFGEPQDNAANMVSALLTSRVLE